MRAEEGSGERVFGKLCDEIKVRRIGKIVGFQKRAGQTDRLSQSFFRFLKSRPFFSVTSPSDSYFCERRSHIFTVSSGRRDKSAEKSTPSFKRIPSISVSAASSNVEIISSHSCQRRPA